jgi:hypothetical protein
MRAYMEAGLAPRTALQVAGRVLDSELGDDFATVVLAVHDPVRGTLTYAGAGHPAPVLLGPPAHEPVTALSSPPVGAGVPTGFRQTTVSLPPGSAACFFTDGVVEARADGKLIGRERLAAMLEELGPYARADAVLDRVASEADQADDDMAVCLVRPDHAAEGDALRVEELEIELPDLDRASMQRFLRACGVAPSAMPDATRAARAAVAQFGGAVLRVQIGDGAPAVDVLPRNVESLELASRQRSAAAAAAP